MLQVESLCFVELMESTCIGTLDGSNGKGNESAEDGSTVTQEECKSGANVETLSAHSYFKMSRCLHEYETN